MPTRDLAYLLGSKEAWAKSLWVALLERGTVSGQVVQMMRPDPYPFSMVTDRLGVQAGTSAVFKTPWAGAGMGWGCLQGSGGSLRKKC